MLIVGRHALNWHLPKAKHQMTVDTDAICTIEEFEESVALFKAAGPIHCVPTSPRHFVLKTDRSIWEYEIAWPGSTAEELLTLANGEPASLDMLLLLKLSHRYLRNSPHFHKTMKDIHFLRELGAKVPDEWLPLLKRREEETYTYAHPELNTDKKGFFTDSFYIYDHDTIHAAVAVEDTPAYTKFLKDGQEVAVDKKKWDKLDHHTKLLAGLEESYVLALERSLIPAPGVLTPAQAFDIALRKVCTSITSGWFREFCWEHYNEIADLYDESFVAKFNTALKAGNIRKFNELT